MCKICASNAGSVEGFKKMLSIGFGLPRVAIDCVFPLGAEHLEDSDIVRIIEHVMRMSIEAERSEKNSAQ